MITLALSQMIYFFYLQAPFTHGEDGIQGMPQGHLFGFFDLSNPTVLYYFVAGGLPVRLPRDLSAPSIRRSARC